MTWQPTSVPPSVAEALSDTALRPMTRLAMWYLVSRLDLQEFREVKTLSLAAEMKIEDVTAGRCLRDLVAAGYIELHPILKPRAFRLYWSRRRPSDVVRSPSSKEKRSRTKDSEQTSAD